MVASDKAVKEDLVAVIRAAMVVARDRVGTAADKAAMAMMEVSLNFFLEMIK